MNILKSLLAPTVIEYKFTEVRKSTPPNMDYEREVVARKERLFPQTEAQRRIVELAIEAGMVTE